MGDDLVELAAVGLLLGPAFDEGLRELDERLGGVGRQVDDTREAPDVVEGIPERPA